MTDANDDPARAPSAASGGPARGSEPSRPAAQPARPAAPQPSLARRLTTRDAVGIGLAAMIGAGVFSAFAPAAQAAGVYLLAGLALALVVAALNASAVSQLAAQYPVSGGAYAYGRERLGEWAGFVAGWGFVVGKTASAAAMALTFAAYAVPEAWQRPVAIGAVVAIAAATNAGVSRTARLARVLVAVVLAGLAVTVAAAWLQLEPGILAHAPGHLAPSAATLGADPWGTALGVLQSAGILFFAFAGYARIATLGEEVVRPERTIPRAIAITLPVVALLYLVVAVTLLVVLAPQGLAASRAPLADAVAAWPWAVWLVGATAAIASLGALLAGVAGVSRTALAMAREGDLPRAFARVDERRRVPALATWVVAAAVVALVLVGGIREVIGFSSAGVLVYYFIACVAAATQSGGHRRMPRWLNVAGAALCALLVVAVPVPSLLGAIAVYAVGLAGRGVAVLRRSRA